jgi:XTP/dITP diphosphohydrolase
MGFLFLLLVIMIELVFATNNPHKLREIGKLAGEYIRIHSLSDLGCYDNIPETSNTLQGNASQKSWFIYNKFGKNCFADDTGLEVESLNGRPGAYSARYAGPEHNPENNIIKLLDELKQYENRKAQFRTVISLVLDGKEYFFEGIVKGKILFEKHGDKGFGYDPVFLPDGQNKSFAEMNLEKKNFISHRARAIESLIQFLNKV